MRLLAFVPFVAVALAAGCDRNGQPDAPARTPSKGADASARVAPAGGAASWQWAAGDGTAALAVADSSGRTSLRMWCGPGDALLRVNVPGFAPIASEERMSFGQGGEVVALVAGTSGDATRGGVTAETPVPDNLRTLLSGPVSATYGAQLSGPHPAPPAELVSRFVDACTARTTRAGDAQPATRAAAVPAPSPAAGVSACEVQDGRRIPANRMRAVGTEPFWGAQVDGRCVTYSSPDNPAGTRVWTRFSGSAAAGTWTGALDGRPFVLRTRPQPGCTDGMSDRRYPIAVMLAVRGEQRSGCAAPE